MNTPCTLGSVRELAELDQILALQRANLAASISADEANAQGS